MDIIFLINFSRGGLALKVHLFYKLNGKKNDRQIKFSAYNLIDTTFFSASNYDIKISPIYMPVVFVLNKQYVDLLQWAFL